MRRMKSGAVSLKGRMKSGADFMIPNQNVTLRHDKCITIVLRAPYRELYPPM